MYLELCLAVVVVNSYLTQIKWRGEVGQALQKHNADVIRVISYEVHSCHCSILVKRQGELGRFATF